MTSVSTWNPAREIYIAGPMRKIQWYNFPAFFKAEAELEKEGWKVVNPARIERERGYNPFDHCDQDWAVVPPEVGDIANIVWDDLHALMGCDAIYLLDGWRESTGARAEKAVAEWLGLEILGDPGYAETPSVVNEDSVLLEASRLTAGDRQNQYGPPDQDFSRTAQMWTALKGVKFEPWEVAAFQICIKLSRQTHQHKRDNWVDIAGYAHCGNICEEEQAKRGAY